MNFEIVKLTLQECQLLVGPASPGRPGKADEAHQLQRILQIKKKYLSSVNEYSIKLKDKALEAESNILFTQLNYKMMLLTQNKFYFMEAWPHSPLTESTESGSLRSAPLARFEQFSRDFPISYSQASNLKQFVEHFTALQKEI